MIQKRSESYAKMLDDSDNPYHNGKLDKAQEWNLVVDEVVELGLEDEVEECSPGVLAIKNYYFYPSSGKWRVRGKRVIYRSRGFKDFYMRFVNGN